jgi:DnaJ-class molecular chaperone
MKTIRTYLSGCTWCNATGVVASKDYGMKTTPLMTPCPVCNGSKTIIVTETIETEDHVTMEDCKADDKAREERIKGKPFLGVDEGVSDYLQP